jgi:hypothetical protein
MNLRISIKDGVSPRLASVMKMFSGSGLAAMHRADGVEMQRITVDHLAARPGNHWSVASEKVAQPAALSADASGATLTIKHPGITRAFRTITIVPRESKALAIPISPISKGFRAAELWDRMKLFIPKGTRIIAANIGGQLTPLYVLCSKVTQRQDRSLLPSDGEFQRAAVKGAMGYLGLVRAQGGKA